MQNYFAPPLLEGTPTQCPIFSEFRDIAWPPTSTFLEKQPDILQHRMVRLHTQFSPPTVYAKFILWLSPFHTLSRMQMRAHAQAHHSML